MAFYAQEAIDHLYEQKELARSLASTIAGNFMARSFRTKRAKEYATHGVGRRVLTLTRCISNLYNALPPENEGIPALSNVEDAKLNLQAFVINLYGCLDNFAWLIALEKPVLSKKGFPLEEGHVGLQKPTVKKALSSKTQEYLTQAQPWFDYLNNFRHSLAHRIPVYIPPSTTYKDGSRGFEPIMIHSFVESVGTIAFHGQMLNDFMTLYEISELMLNDLGEHQPVAEGH